MPRKYTMSEAVYAQRKAAALARQAAMDHDQKREAMRPAFSRGGWPKGKPRGKKCESTEAAL